MDTTGSTTVYSTSTDSKPVFEDLDPELRYELGLPSDSELDFPIYNESDYYDEWCFVCSRPTDHRGEHDDLVEQGKASYDRTSGTVFSIR